ncbi:MAG: YbhB/YbcL family Raf kinase inhibitor-like protein [Candidatus Deferrimicrobiaceae bacterium]
MSGSAGFLHQHDIGSKSPAGGKWIAPGALQGTNDFGKQRYGGPCPPSGTHRYFLKLYALDAPLTLNAGATKARVEEAMSDHLLEEGVAIRCNNLPALAYKIDSLLSDKKRFGRMRQAVRRLARPNAAADVVSLVSGSIPSSKGTASSTI